MLVGQLGCAGGSGGSSVPSVPGPTSLSVSEGPAINEITLSWKPATGTVDGYVLEARLGNGEFTAMNDARNLIPASASGLLVDFSSSAPELVDYGFRMKALSTGNSSPWSNEAAYQRSLATPRIDNARYLSDAEGIKVSWTTYSQMADGSKLERAPSDANGNPSGNWTVVANSSGTQTTFSDKAIDELTAYTYRISNTRQGKTGPASAPSPSTPTPMFPPGQVRVTPCPGGLQIDWINRSTHATQISIARGATQYSIEKIALLSTSISSYQDINLQPGYYTYVVTAIGGTTDAGSQPVQAMTSQPPGAIVMSSRTVKGPFVAADAALHPQGFWAFLQINPIQIFWNDLPWAPYDNKDQPAFGYPTSLYFDSRGVPHGIYETKDPANPAAGVFTHVSHDGGWTKEVLSTRLPVVNNLDPGFSTCIDSQDRIHALLHVPDTTFPHGGTTRNLVHAFHENGGWVQESLSSLSPPVEMFSGYFLDMDSTGQPHVILGLSGRLLELTRPTLGSPWTSAPIPTGPVLASFGNFLGSWLDPDNAYIFTEQHPGGDLFENVSLLAIRKNAGAWEPPVVLSTRAPGWGVAPAFARSRDRSRVALTYFSYSTGLFLFTNDGTGWHQTILEPPNVNGIRHRVGFDDQGRIHILVMDFAGSHFKEWYE